jgi:hypothetical protein
VEPFHEGRNAINDRCNTLNEDAVTLDLGVVMAAVVEAGLGSSYTSEWSCEERKTAEIRFSAKLSWERAVLTAVGQAWGQEVRQKAGRGGTALGAPWPEI